MKIAIMQPYFFPYIGYFQLIGAVDKFVIYDNIQYTKKGWINRNRILQNGKDEFISIPVKKDSDYLNVCDRYIADNAHEEIGKNIRRIEASYRKAPYFSEVFPLIKACFESDYRNLFEYIHNSVVMLCEELDITTKIVISSELQIKESLKSQDRVLAICKSLNATGYVNPIGGVELYAAEAFKRQGITLNFLQPMMSLVYKQFNNDFVPWLSIIDVMMFNSKERIKEMLTQYTLQ